MKITALQSDIVWGSPDENLRRFGDLLPRVAGETGAGLVVLPEMFTTGFMPVPGAAADSCPAALCSLEAGYVPGAAADASPVVGWMRRTAARLGMAISGSVATRLGGGLCANRLWFVRPDGSADYYDKVHLFAYGGEAAGYRPGCRRTVAEYGGIRFLLQVCYDLRFPVFARNRGDYDAILYAASWPASRIAVWQTLLRARAIENQCYVVGVNRVGEDPACSYPGCSALVGPKGETLAEGTAAYTQWITAVLDMERLEAFRQKFPVLADADSFRLD